MSLTKATPHDDILVAGIKTVGVGKYGSNDCPAELVDELIALISSGEFNLVQANAFFSALWLKGLSDEEKRLASALPDKALEDAAIMVDYLMPGVPADMRGFAIRMLERDTLTLEESRQLGAFLFTQDEHDAARGFFASALRVRYETPEEYQGICDAMQDTMAEPFRNDTPDGNPIVQIAEPFDGVNRSYLLTPLIANLFVKKGYRVLNMVGRSSGPKFGLNLHDLGQGLGATYLNDNRDFTDDQPELGYYCDQKTLSPAADHWVNIRHQTVKRPFMATLEKYFNPVGAFFLLNSAFHAPYTEKMIDIAERQGFPVAFSTFRSVEGTLGLSLARNFKYIISIRQSDGSYQRETFSVKPEEFGFATQDDVKVEPPDPADNAKHIRAFLDAGTTGDDYLDTRIKFTLAVYERVIDYIQTNAPQS